MERGMETRLLSQQLDCSVHGLKDSDGTESEWLCNVLCLSLYLSISLPFAPSLSFSLSLSMSLCVCTCIYAYMEI